MINLWLFISIVFIISSLSDRPFTCTSTIKYVLDSLSVKNIEKFQMYKEAQNWFTSENSWAYT